MPHFVGMFMIYFSSSVASASNLTSAFSAMWPPEGACPATCLWLAPATALDGHTQLHAVNVAAAWEQWHSCEAQQTADVI